MEIKQLINLTPHAVDIQSTDEPALIVSVPPSGTVARCAEERESVQGLALGLHHIPATRATYGAVTGLPAPTPGVAYVVSALVLAQCAGRDDVFAPGPAVRNAAGQVVGCLGLSAAPAAAAAMTLGEFRVYIDVVGCLALGGHEWVDPAETARVYARIQTAPNDLSAAIQRTVAEARTVACA